MNTTDSIKSDENTQYDACAKKFCAITERFEVSAGGTKQLKSNAAQALIELAASVKSIDEYHNVIRLITSHRPMDDQDYKNVKSAINRGFGRSRTVIEADIKKITKETNEAKKAAAVKSGQILDGMKQSQIAAALRGAMIDMHRWDGASLQWFEFMGDIWRPCSDNKPTSFVMDALDRGLLGYEAATLSGTITLLKTKLYQAQWADDKNLLPLTNGVYNLQTRELGGYEGHQFTWQVPYGYDPSATCPTVDEFLSHAVAGDAGMVKLLMAWMWAVLFGRYDLQKYFEAIGAGGTGKTTFTTLCGLLVGEENTRVSSLKELEENRFETANLYGKRLLILPDSEAWGGSASVLKQITGGDPVRYERKNIQAGEAFVYRGMVMVAANSAILSKDYSSGLTRRKIPTQFDQRATDEMKAKHRPHGGIIEVMKAEMPGLLNALLAMDEAEAIGTLTNPDGEAMRQKISSELRSNPVLGWLDENCTTCAPLTEETFVGKANQPIDDYLYPNFCDWCAGNGRVAVASNKFTDTIVDQMKTRGFMDADNLKKTRVKSKPGMQGSVIRGLRLRTVYESELPGMISGH